MLSWRKDSVDISHHVPAFRVRYIGSTETFTASGQGCTTEPLQKLWNKASTEKDLRKVAVTFSARGIDLSGLESTTSEHKLSRWFSIEDISYCSADKNVSDRLFCWICKDSLSGRLELHGFLCSTGDKARMMASVLSRAFQLAYKDWSAARQREKRRKAVSSAHLLEECSDIRSSGYVTPPSGRTMCPPWTSSSTSMVNAPETIKSTNTVSD